MSELVLGASVGRSMPDQFQDSSPPAEATLPERAGMTAPIQETVKNACYTPKGIMISGRAYYEGIIGRCLRYELPDIMMKDRIDQSKETGYVE